MGKGERRVLRPDQIILAAAAAVMFAAFNLPRAPGAGHVASTDPVPASRWTPAGGAPAWSGGPKETEAPCDLAGWQTLTPGEWARRFPGLDIQPACPGAATEVAVMPQSPHP